MRWPQNTLARGSLYIGALRGLLGVPIGCAASPVRTLGTPGTKVPCVTGQNLNRERVRFPTDIMGRPTLLLIAFYRHQQRDIDTWLSRLNEIERAVPDLNVLAQVEHL